MTEDELRERVRALIAKANPDRVDMFAFRGAQMDAFGNVNAWEPC